MSDALLTEQFNAVMDKGYALSESKDLVLYEDSNRKFTMGELMEGMDRAPRMLRAATAIMLKNTQDHFNSMSESTKTLNAGDFPKFAMPMVRAVFPNLIAQDLVSVQPMPGPTSTVFYQQFLYNQTKGSAVAGQDMIENPNADYSSELIDEEIIAAAGAAAAIPAFNLDYTPVKPGSVTITDGSQVITDDGNGALVGDVGAPSTIDYASGLVTLTLSAVPGSDVSAQYEYDSEENDTIPEVDMNLKSSPVIARTDKLRVKWTTEGEQDLRNVHGVEAETELVGSITNEIKFEIDRKILRDIRRIAANNQPAFDLTPPSGISFGEHKLSIVDSFVRASNQIYKATQRAKGNWLVCGIDVANVIETLPGFKAEGTMTGRGVSFVGTLNNRWRVYVDTYMPDSAYVIGFRGDSMFEIGYVWAPYVPIFTTPRFEPADFTVQKGVASRYGKKVIDSRFYTNGSVLNAIS